MGRAARRAIGISRVVLRGGEEVSAIAGAMHESIAFHEPLPYRIVAGSFRVLGRIAAAMPVREDAPDEGQPESAGWRRFRGAAMGVIGDTLEATTNPLACRLGARDRDGAETNLSRLAADSPRGVVLFVHGLCGSELDWKGEAHDALVRDLRASGTGVAWIRYNTGRAVAENGHDLAALLESAGDGATLTLVGHSMGGLVIRSACAHAAEADHRWLAHLSAAAYLGTPHLGAPLERAGHGLQTLLGATPYAAALARAGDLRSRGITDMRGPSVTTPWAPHVRHLLIAARTVPRPADRWVGDGMVPLASALAEGLTDPPARDAGPALERHLLDDLGHLGLLTDPRVYSLIRESLFPYAAPESRR